MLIIMCTTNPTLMNMHGCLVWQRDVLATVSGELYNARVDEVVESYTAPLMCE